MRGLKCYESACIGLGGVISKTLFETHDLTEKVLGLALGPLTWRGPFAPETDVPWQRMQAGEITERDYWNLRMRETADLVGADWSTFPDFLAAVRGEAEVIVTAEDGHRAVAMGVAAQMAAREKRRVDMTELGL